MRNTRAGARASGGGIASLIGCLAVMLTACAPSPLDALPDGVSIDVYQTRFDAAEHKIEVAVTNGTDMPFEITSLSFSSPAFSPAVHYEKPPTTVRPRTVTDFRLPLPAANCDASGNSPSVQVTFTFNGQRGAATLEPNDRIHQLESIRAEDCREEAIAQIASITPASALRWETVNGESAAILDFSVNPKGSPGILVLNSVRGSALLSVWDPAAGSAGNTVPLNLDLGKLVEPASFSLALLPARCDPHVVLEDKRGTIFTFSVTTKLDTGRLFIGVGDDVREEFYEFVADSCSWP